MGAIRNRSELTSGVRADLRRACIDIADAGLAALDPGIALRKLLRVDADGLTVDGHEYPLTRPIHVLGAGKATFAMAHAAEELLGDRLAGGFIVVPGAHNRPLSRIEVAVGDHPIPGAASVGAGVQLMRYASRIESGDLVLCMFTGGSSALVSVPPTGVAPTAKQHLHSLLVASGLDIVSMNSVRKHVSAFKGGRLAGMLGGSPIVNLTVSDVAGDIVDAITDPTVQDTTTRHDAISVLQGADLWNRVDPSIQAHLGSDSADSPHLDGQPIQTVLVATGDTACSAMQKQAESNGLKTRIVSTTWKGEATEFGRELAGMIQTSPGTALIGCGGETTVHFKNWETRGSGGPNQELAMAASLEMRGGPPAALLALDTDGSDGASDYAGALVDDGTSALWFGAGVDAAAALAAHDAGPALAGIGQAIVTGPTLTNVNDLFVVVVGD